jgi:hypothetical protein
MKNNKAKLLAVAVAMGISTQASAAIELYNQDGTTFAADGHFNAFVVHTNDETQGATEVDQTRVRMGFLPNYIGFNVSKQIDDLKVGGRSSFWVTINDGTNNATATSIDIRQFYGTVDGEFGQVLIGRDFGLYQRSNLFSDELLLGTGRPKVDANGVTYGNIGVGYSYANPVAQITYRSPVNNGLQLAVGIVDPASGSDAANEGEARLEAELTFKANDMFNAWISTLTGENIAGASESGVAYGAKFASNGFALTLSGFDQKNVNSTVTNWDGTGDSDGYLAQASYSTGANRFVVSYGETDNEAVLADTEMTSVAWFHDINSNLKLVAEVDMFENEAGEEINQYAIGAALSW